MGVVAFIDWRKRRTGVANAGGMRSSRTEVELKETGGRHRKGAPPNVHGDLTNCPTHRIPFAGFCRIRGPSVRSNPCTADEEHS